MALISCPECNHQISDKALSCPSCGYPLSTTTNIQNNTTNETSKNEKYCVILKRCDGMYKIETIKKIRILLNTGLKEAKDLVDTTPNILINNISLERAKTIKDIFTKIGAIIEIEPYNEQNQNLSSTQTKQQITQILNKYQEDTVRCPRCGSTTVTTGQRGFNIWTGFLGSNKTVNRCAKCGYDWQPKW